MSGDRGRRRIGLERSPDATAFEGPTRPLCLPAHLLAIRQDQNPARRGRRRRGLAAIAGGRWPRPKPSGAGRAAAAARAARARRRPRDDHERDQRDDDDERGQDEPGEDAAQTEEQLEEDAKRQRDEPEDRVQQMPTRMATTPMTSMPARPSTQSSRNVPMHSWLRRNPKRGSPVSAKRGLERRPATRATGSRRSSLLGGGLGGLGDLVEHEAAPHFLHRDALGLERVRAMAIALGLFLVVVVSRGSAPRRSCLARIAATSTKRKRLSIGGAFGRGAGGASSSAPGSGVRSAVSAINS